nr:hypothetical protein [Tanacetum cinerariifolium]
MNQTQRANNSIKNDSLAALYGKYHYEEGLIDDIYASETQRFTIQTSTSKALISNNYFQNSDSDIVEDNRRNNEFMADLNAEYHEIALLENQKRFYKRSKRVGSARKPMEKSKETIDELTKRKDDKRKGDKRKSDKGLVAESFDWDDESVSSDDEGTTKFKAFMAITGDEPSVRKDYTHVDLQYVKDQRINLVNKFNALKQDLALHKSELCNLKNTVSINCSLQNKVIRVNLENESLKDEIYDLKKVIEKWTCSKVTLDQLISKKIPGNIIKALGGKGRRKENNSKEVLFTKADVSTSETRKKISIQGSDVAGFDKSKVECFNYHKMGHFTRECRAPRSQERVRKESYRQGSKSEEKSSKALMAIDGRLLSVLIILKDPVSEFSTSVIEFGDSYNVPANADPADSRTGRTITSTTDDMQKKKNDVKARTILLLSLPDEHQLRTITPTTEDMQKKKNDVKERTTLLLSLPDEHQLRFSKYKTAKELWVAILKTFGDNDATKKRKNNLLKQQYGNFKAEGTKTLEQTFNRLEVIVSQLQFMDVDIEKDDPNQKFLTSLA